MKQEEDYVIKVTDATVRFNMASEKIDNLKEYFVKLVKKELLFQEFFALKDVSFKVKRGEAWGLVGTNGSGKSTLLKLICGILKPYKGSVKINGSIAPLIELGAGFDGELTATENIYLNGAVLGYSKEFMDQHYNEIVEFAELHDFMNMPIKNYSSGMYMRLAFSVAIHVDPDILVVDEVLAVGDAAFQKKCINKIMDFKNSGKTIVFVSHDMNSIKMICDRVFFIKKGGEMIEGSVDEMIDLYNRIGNI